MDNSEQLLEELTNAYGPPGHEQAVTVIFKNHLENIANISYDKLGSIVAEKKGSSDRPRVMVVGHCDEIGFMVTEITEHGFLKMLPLGGWWGHVALGQRVMVLGRKGPTPGVIGSTPPHVLADDQRKKVVDVKDMYIDVGVREKFDVKKKLGIGVGDVVVPDSKFTVMSPKGMYLAKAIDDRYGCAVAIEVMKKLAKAKHPNTLYSVGSVQEEVGCRGAGTVGWLVDPDVCIVMDVGIAKDTPGIKETGEEKLGNGPSVLVLDGRMIPNVRLRQFVTDTADKLKLKYHLASMARGATDGSQIHVQRIGVPTVVIGAPIRYIHSHNSIMYRPDYDASVRLVTELVKHLDKKRVDSFTQG